MYRNLIVECQYHKFHFHFVWTNKTRFAQKKMQHNTKITKFGLFGAREKMFWCMTIQIIQKYFPKGLDFEMFVDMMFHNFPRRKPQTVLQITFTSYKCTLFHNNKNQRFVWIFPVLVSHVRTKCLHLASFNQHTCLWIYNRRNVIQKKVLKNVSIKNVPNLDGHVLHWKGKKN